MANPHSSTDLSILITNYNEDCRRLIQDLHRMAEAWDGTWEIIIVDDASPRTDKTRANADQCSALHGVTYHINETNLGAANCRNMLADMAQGEWLIFIDSDAAVVSDDFISKYWAARHEADVIVGGLLHPSANPNPEASLRYKYERNADLHRNVAERNLHPYAKFTAFNIMLKHSVMQQVRFDVQCKEYGYEDALFGVELRQRGISLIHIDNILLHTGLNSNEAFLKRTEISLHTLHKLRTIGKMEGESRVGNLADRLTSLHLDGMYRLFFRLFKTSMLRNLHSSNPSLTIFSLYKLGYFISITQPKHTYTK